MKTTEVTHEITPGPWEIWGNPGEKDLSVGPVAGGVAIAQIVTTTGEGFFNEDTANRAAANARAIAALPDLLAALEECITEDPGAACFNTGKKTRRLEAITKIAREAIEKATVTPYSKEELRNAPPESARTCQFHPVTPKTGNPALYAGIVAGLQAQDYVAFGELSSIHINYGPHRFRASEASGQWKIDVYESARHFEQCCGPVDTVTLPIEDEFRNDPLHVAHRIADGIQGYLFLG